MVIVRQDDRGIVNAMHAVMDAVQVPPFLNNIAINDNGSLKADKSTARNEQPIKR